MFSSRLTPIFTVAAGLSFGLIARNSGGFAWLVALLALSAGLVALAQQTLP